MTRRQFPSKKLNLCCVLHKMLLYTFQNKKCKTFKLGNPKAELFAQTVHCMKIFYKIVPHTSTFYKLVYCTRWFKYDRYDLCVNKSQFVLVIFEPPCTYTFYKHVHCTQTFHKVIHCARTFQEAPYG
jgi:hypothetical protein